MHHSWTLNVNLPLWLQRRLEHGVPLLETAEARMALVVELAAENVRQGTGGPFAAAVFDRAGYLIAPGVNLVTSAQCALLHAEMVALMLASRALGRHDLSDGGRVWHTLYSSAEPCAMCLGAVPWSGVAELTCAARKTDVEAIGFDEGARPDDWVASLRQRGVDVRRDLLRDAGARVLSDYARLNGMIY